jgi:hypothetical protein
MAPEVFGLASIVLTFIYGLQMFTDVGSGPAVVQSPRGDDEVFLDTVWSIQCIRGSMLFLASCAIAIPVSRFYDQPMLAWVIPAAGLGPVFDGFVATSLLSASSSPPRLSTSPPSRSWRSSFAATSDRTTSGWSGPSSRATWQPASRG